MSKKLRYPFPIMKVGNFFDAPGRLFYTMRMLTKLRESEYGVKYEVNELKSGLVRVKLIEGEETGFSFEVHNDKP